MPTGPASDLEAPKLRSSCDSCGSAKVKCDRERPKCSRCSALNMVCVYGPSRKLGKPKRKRPASSTESIVGKRICTTEIAVRDGDQITTMGFGELRNASETAQHNFSYPAADIRPFEPTSGFTTAPGMDFCPSLPCDAWPQLVLGDWNELESFGAGQDFPSDFPSKPTSIASKRSDNESHSCPRESYEIFRDLICPSPSLHAPESNSITVSAQLDQVLQFNRDAIDRLSRVLRCPCSKSGHRAMVHASIVSRILIWYQQAAGWTGSSSWGPRPSGSSTSSSGSSPSPTSPSGLADASMTSPPSLVQATGFAVEHVPVSIGAFSIEDESVQAAFRNQLVLSELKKADVLIKLFISQDSGESPGAGLPGLYSHMGTWLQSEHSRTVRILRLRLRTLNESLES